MKFHHNSEYVLFKTDQGTYIVLDNFGQQIPEEDIALIRYHPDFEGWDESSA